MEMFIPISLIYGVGVIMMVIIDITDNKKLNAYHVTLLILAGLFAATAFTLSDMI